MPGFIYCHGYCFGCGRAFSFNPHRVPSITPPGGHTREPVCLECVKLVNPDRKRKGLPLIVPHPDAYDPLPEEEL